jgi:hypothetical protein
MIRLPLKPFIRTELLRRLVTITLFLWAMTSSIVAVRSQPRVVLIGMDDTGTRVITQANDPLIAQERVRFIREFLRLYYRYDGAEYATVISQAGALMSDPLWHEKEPEYQRMIKKFEVTPISQDAELLDLREVSDHDFEADLKITVRSRLEQKSSKYRVTLQIAPRKRNVENPYPFEVVQIHENEIQ